MNRRGAATTAPLLLFGLLLLLAACGGGGDEAAAPAPAPPAPVTTPAPDRASVTLQLPAEAGARFAGYYAAAAQRYYADEGLDVTIRPGSPGTAEQAVSNGDAELGVGMLPASRPELVGIARVFRRGDDGVLVRDDWVADERNRDVALRFLRASIRGWLFCRDLPDDCLQTVLAEAPALREDVQRRRLNDTNARIWPNEPGIGVIEERGAAYLPDLVEEALVSITDDVYAPGWTRPADR